MPRPTLTLPIHEQPRKKMSAPPPVRASDDEPIRTALRSVRKEASPRPKLSIPPPSQEQQPSAGEATGRPHTKTRPRSPTKEPLSPSKLPNSPRSEWISNVSQLKQRQGDTKAYTTTPNTTPLSWNELEATLSKRMREPSNTGKPSLSKERSSSSHNSQAKARTTAAASSHHRGHATTTPPRLHIPRDGNNRQKASATPNASSTNATNTTAQKVSRRKVVETREHVSSDPSTEFSSCPVARRKTNPSSASGRDTAQAAPAATPQTAAAAPNANELTPLTPSFQSAVAAAPVAPPPSTIEETVNKALEPRVQKRNPGVESLVPTEATIGFQATLPSQQQPSQATKVNAVSTVEANTSTSGTPQTKVVPSGGGGTMDRIRPKAAAVSSSTSVAPNVLAPKASRPTKPKGKMSWLRMVLTSNGAAKQQQQLARAASSGTSKSTKSHRSNKSSKSNRSKQSNEAVASIPEPTPPEPIFRFTTPLQQLLWLSALSKAIKEARSPSPVPLPAASTKKPQRALSSDEKETQQQLMEGVTDENGDAVLEAAQATDAPAYYNHTQDTGVYVDYSTFDDGDGESVSSMELLFQWLTCRDHNDGNAKRTPRSVASINPPDTVVATAETNMSDDLSIDMNAQSRRRTLFSR